ncbi:MAG: ATP-grasp domain-containing protein [Candidatus Kaiserbacteria bacterium]|nr:ATP-grasp domain-containing protein [Candidatus Kaiserbacteria bacterium]
MKKKEKNIIVYVMMLPPGAVESIRAYERREKRKFRIMLIRDIGHAEYKERESYSGLDILLECDLSTPARIAEALAPYQSELCAITCRSESHMARFIEVIPHVPYLRTPTTESLMWATDKLEMRRRFRLLAPKFSPKYTVVKENTKAERTRVIEKIKFPMIVKPTNLAQSLLVTVCYHEDELKRSLTNLGEKIDRTYAENGRTERPRIIVEEFMEGDMYSVDAYVNSRGKVYFCPMVRVLTGHNIGHEDFFNYLHLSPTNLKQPSIERAHLAGEAGIHALGLRNTTAHVELMKIDDVWKIIEIGPRVGGFRDKLHRLSCDIDHSLNDILIRLPKKPIIPKKCKGFAATLKWYPKKEGRIVGLKGIKKCQELKSFVEIKLIKKIGDRCQFARHGGKAVFTLTLYNTERAKLLADIRRVEKLIEVKIG